MEGQNVLSPLEGARFVSKISQDVKINMDGVSKVAKIMYEKVMDGSYSIKTWKQHSLHPKTMDKSAVNWIFFADTLNFSFWSDDENKKFGVLYGGVLHTGYWSLCAAMNRALDEGIPLTEPSYYAKLNIDDMQHIFRSDTDTEMPMLLERLNVIKKAGIKLLEKYDGSFVNCIEQSKKSAQNLLSLITEDFVSYRDQSLYNGKTISIYKRAQILIADVWACFEGQGYGDFYDIDTITMFADYRIPQALVFFGALEYSETLMDFLMKDKILSSGDRYEVELRSCSIWCTELIRRETRRLLDNTSEGKNILLNSILIDHYLWDHRREHASEMRDVPFHKIRCIYY